MKKTLTKALLILLAVFIMYCTYDFFWQRSREKEIEERLYFLRGNIQAVQEFCRDNAEEIEFLTAACIEKQAVAYIGSELSIVDYKKSRNAEIDVDKETGTMLKQMSEALPDIFHSVSISPIGIKLSIGDVSYTPMFIIISAPPYTEEYSSYIAGNIGTVVLKHTWSIDIALLDPYDRERAREICENWK